MPAEIRPLSEDAILLSFGEAIDPALTPVIAAWCEAIRGHLGEVVTDLVPSYSSITVHYDPVSIDFRRLINKIRQLSEMVSRNGQPSNGRRIELPVWYHPSVGPDLRGLADACGLTAEQVIDHHTATEYQVYALGFSPGFGFMGQVNPAIAHPRKARPRVHVPAGSVGIANRQTAVYPSASPGGWQLIGRCPTQLFSEADLALLSVGDTVHFRSVDHDTFVSLGGDDSPCPEDPA